MIAATPLVSIGWKRLIRKMRIRWRPNTTIETQLAFLDDLIEAARHEQRRLIDG